MAPTPSPTGYYTQDEARSRIPAPGSIWGPPRSPRGDRGDKAARHSSDGNRLSRQHSFVLGEDVARAPAGQLASEPGVKGKMTTSGPWCLATSILGGNEIRDPF